MQIGGVLGDVDVVVVQNVWVNDVGDLCQIVLIVYEQIDRIVWLCFVEVFCGDIVVVDGGGFECEYQVQIMVVVSVVGCVVMDDLFYWVFVKGLIWSFSFWMQVLVSVVLLLLVVQVGNVVVVGRKGLLVILWKIRIGEWMIKV